MPREQSHHVARRLRGQRADLICVLRKAGVSALVVALGSGLAAPDTGTPRPSLAGWWSLGEGAGTMAHDLSGNGRHGVLVGGPVWVEGHAGGHALSFDGEDDCVVLPDLGTVEQYPFTFTAWIRTSCTEDREMTAVIQEDSGNSGRRVQLYLSSRGEPKWNIRNGDPEAEVIYPADVRDGGWHFLAGVSRAADRHELYVDAARPCYSDAFVDSPSVNSAAIGNWQSNPRHSKWFEGEIDDVRIYVRALRPAEIREIMGPLPQHRLTVRGGTGGGVYTPGTTVSIKAGPAPQGKPFTRWRGDTATVQDPQAESTIVVMPARAARISTVYEECGEVLYNGIRLAKDWPLQRERLSADPPLPPYLVSPPEVIPIDVGRQLFVDDFLIEATTLSRSYHRPEFYEGNPVLTPDEPWERVGRGPMAIPHSGGVCFDPADGLFKMWYIAGYQEGVGLAYSEDGLHWHRPRFDHVLEGSNLVYDKGSRASTVWLRADAEDPARRFVMFSSRPGAIWFSPDGVSWGEPIKAAGPMLDRTTIFRNPFRDVWVYSIKATYEGKRARRYWETPELVGHPQSAWSAAEDPVLWVGADSGDEPRDDLRVPCQLYSLDAVAYESLMLGSFIIWRGDYRSDSNTPEAEGQNELGRPKQNSPCIGFSRDGFHWHRPDRREFLPKPEEPGAWNWGNSQTAAKSPLVVGDRLYFHVAGRGGLQFPGNTYQDAGGSTGVAFLRRDGFASMDAGPKRGTLTTRPLTFQGRHLFVNVDAPEGSLQVEVLNNRGRAIRPFGRGNCVPISADSTIHAVQWRGVEDLSRLSGRPVRLRFHLTNGRLFAFWVTPDALGASYGYVAGGGPGFTSNRDTVGRRAM